MIRPLALHGAVLATAAGVWARDTRPNRPAPDRFPLRILDAGRTDDPDHTKTWGDFLSLWFSKVATTSYTDSEPKDADLYDVILFDAKTRPTPNAIGLSLRPKIPDTFNRASVLVGGAGVMIGATVKSKFDWL